MALAEARQRAAFGRLARPPSFFYQECLYVHHLGNQSGVHASGGATVAYKISNVLQVPAINYFSKVDLELQAVFIV
ncbi:hypothetical protein NDU88_002728 [Pleurodeles waltl]|uniref:Uncharacterized protein n=1 Tax=Pleurodeles waltl TaxID=8319 RepID=A0AAV7Q6W1_PLEWA|nr:hypothetical protein NDU88_002728 [Pleurodeles waltl]